MTNKERRSRVGEHMRLDEWLDIADKAMKKAWWPWDLPQESIRGIASSLLASFMLLLKERGFVIVRKESNDQEV